MLKVNNLKEFHHQTYMDLIEVMNKNISDYLVDENDMALYIKKKNMTMEAAFDAVLSALNSIDCKDCRNGAIKSFIKELQKQKVK